MLYDLKILKKGTKTSEVFDEIFSRILYERYETPSKFIKKTGINFWN